MKKTIEQWLKEGLIPQEYENARDSKKEFINWKKEEADALSHAIVRGFWWDTMPEGWDYWCNKYFKQLELEKGKQS